MKKKLFLVIMLLLLVVGCGKKEEKEEKKEEVVEPKNAIVISDNKEHISLLDDNFDKVWGYKVKDIQNYYNITRVDGNYIYYVDGDKLYRYDYVNEKNEDLEITMKDYWFFEVSGDDLIYNVLYDIYYVNLKDKKTSKLSIQSNNSIALIDGLLFYTNKNDGSLKMYNLSTKENTMIDKKARILEANKNSVLYVNEDNKYMIYNIEDKKSTLAIQGWEYALSSGDNYPIHLYNNKVYAIKEDTLAIYNEDKEEKVYTHKFNKDEEIHDFIMLNENKVLLIVNYLDPDIKCESEYCDPVGELKFILVDIKNKKEKEVKNNSELFDEESDLQYIYN